MIIGKFTQKGEVYAGNSTASDLRSLTWNSALSQQSRVTARISLYSVRHARTNPKPSWARHGPRPARPANAYLSVKLDSPVLATPINGALTRQQDGSYAWCGTARRRRLANYRRKLK